MMTDVAVKEAAKAAKRAADAGRMVFVYRQNVPVWKSGWSGEIGGGMAEVIEAIEGFGFRLDHMAFDGMQSSHGGLLLLFRRDRRAAPPSPPQPDMQMPQPSPEWVQQHPYNPQQPGLGQLAREWPPR